ncbi:acyl-CoA dehydrogenase [Oceanobacillus piezotolerans]|uniref:Acyl-CoA dehydrogenase n=1 Tax=Oceanobacillus piezotolerans TaxID=2448030 RepID=A0A498D8Y8_9BACI|nr:acyl-CoA dehydrogenase family protein [Oceanobacillus piezotolerans]RLL46873.1 acyl-CoA dehydrogenase [Oceanobacillus piezotolerans]
MTFEMNEKTKALRAQLIDFMDEYIYPNESVYEKQLNEGDTRWEVPPIIEELKEKAKQAGLWNLFLQSDEHGPGLSNLEYAPLKEIMGRSLIAPEVFNCSAPDTGNMELLEQYASHEQKKKWLKPLLEGEIRSAYVMTEPDVASSDATNIQTSIVRDGDEYVINGRKWWISGIKDPRCKIMILMGKTNPNADRHKQQSMILIPVGTPGVEVKDYLPMYGYDDAPSGHAVVEFNNVRVPVSNMILGEGRGFEIAQGRLGPGRIHHCMRLIGMAERSLELLCKRANERVAFGKKVSEQGVIRNWIAESRIEIDQARLLTLNAAHMMDTVGNKIARKEIAMIKVIVPNMALKVIDRAVQVHGGGGVSDVFPLARLWAHARHLRLADGPDEVHVETVAKLELRRQAEIAKDLPTVTV